MASRLKVCVLACSSVTTGELTMALDLLKRCRRPMELHAVVGMGLINLAGWYGARVHTYPSLGANIAFPRIESTLRTVRPDAIIVADILLMYGLSPEFAGSLGTLVPEALERTRVAALDLYDFDRTAMDVDIFGRRMLPFMPPIPEKLGRLHPCPSLIPQRSTPGRGRYAMVDDVGPLPERVRHGVREELGIPAGEKMVVITTSAWQHRLVQHPEASKIAAHFPSLMFRYLDHAAAQVGGVHVVHVGAQPFPIADGVEHLHYRHLPSIPPEDFQQLLGSADLYLSPNMPASTAVRAAAMRVPVATLSAGARVAGPFSGAAGRALERYLDETNGGYPFHLWPVGMHAMLEKVLQDNPFVTTQRLLDIHRPDEVVESIATLLKGGAEADALRNAQEVFFKSLMESVDTPDDALAHALWES